ncbi:putative DNA-binding transcriptional regulator [Zophobihabitans entericus]|uniref:Putative DNA-binding transcriptional regulator n=2 Tax=Zophobihabitans entericus TaxID=1635327 RepID=A0A6G9IFW2_9GAMM|nr:putative DNA-binding transcriptional regulator [Zophobihabitans entericus]
MKKEWFTSKELIAVDGLPSTTQGINKRARAENWKRRKRTGVQGRGVEYHMSSFPEFIQNSLRLKEDPAIYSPHVKPLDVWVSVYQELTEAEQDLIFKWVLRYGIRELINLITHFDDKNKS